jgi:hypothetical protein
MIDWFKTFQLFQSPRHRFCYSILLPAAVYAFPSTEAAMVSPDDKQVLGKKSDNADQ